MFIITETNCTQCKILKQMLGEHATNIQFIKASENMDLCRQLGIKSIPALVKDDKTVVFDLNEIVSEIKK